MKNRRIAIIISLCIVLIAALPALAEAVPDLKWEGVDEDSGRWEFSWETTTGEYWATVQYESDPDFYTTLSNLQWSREGNRTHVSSPPLSNAPSGLTFTFRVEVKACTQRHEETDDCTRVKTYGWTKLEVEFD